MLTNGVPGYPIVISLACEAIRDEQIAQLTNYVAAGGFLFVGSSSFTRYTNGQTRGDFAIGNQMGIHMVRPGLTNWTSNNYLDKSSRTPVDLPPSLGPIDLAHASVIRGNFLGNFSVPPVPRASRFMAGGREQWSSVGKWRHDSFSSCSTLREGIFHLFFTNAAGDRARRFCPDVLFLFDISPSDRVGF